MRNCHCAKSEDSHWGVNRCEQLGTVVNRCEQLSTGVDRCEQVWKGVNRREQVWTGVNRCEQVWTGRNRWEQVGTGGNRREKFWPGLNKLEQVWSAVFPRRWVARSPKFAYPSTKLHQLYTFWKPLNFRGITWVLLVYINRPVCVRVSVRVITNAYSS